MITNACSQICFVFVCAMRKYLEIDVGRITGTKEEGVHSKIMRRESVSPNKIHGDASEKDIVEAIYVQLQNCDF